MGVYVIIWVGVVGCTCHNVAGCGLVWVGVDRCG